MLSWNDGTPIAIIKGGEKNNCILNIIDSNNNSNNNNNNPDNNDPVKNKTADVVDMNFIKKLKKNLTNKQKKKIDNFLKYDDDYDYEEDEDLKYIFEQIMEEAARRNMKEYVIHDNGTLQVLPNFTQNFKMYIAGAGGSGKTYYTTSILEQIGKVCPKKKIYLFSDVQEDPVIDKIKNLIRIDLEKLQEKLKELGKAEIDPDDFADSVCVFDDIDSLEKNTYKLVSHFRDKLLRRGRHNNISTIVTSHNLTNYADSRVILNESTSITFFIQSSGIDQIKYTLRKYCNLGTAEIKRILSLPSRWTTVTKVCPRLVMFEKGAYLL